MPLWLRTGFAASVRLGDIQVSLLAFFLLLLYVVVLDSLQMSFTSILFGCFTGGLLGPSSCWQQRQVIYLNPFECYACLDT